MGTQPVWWTAGADELVTVELPDDQRELLIQGLIQWGGPTRPTDAVARAMGFADSDAIHREGSRLRTALRDKRPLSVRDWARVVVAAEFVFASHYYGAGTDWEAVTGWTDEETLHLLRAVQRTFAGLRAPPRRGGLPRSDPLADP